jgi:molybdopterin biosynthesis enzyme
MMRTLSPIGALTSLDTAVAMLLDGLEPVAPSFLPLEEALGCIAAEMPPVARPLPAANTAIMDGWAFRALDLVGASAYSPLPLANAPIWVETGDAMPEGCDCVVEAGLVNCDGPIAQAMGEAAPGQGIRRAGEDMEAGRPIISAGQRLSAADLLVARSASVREVAVRAPRLRLIDIAAPNGEQASAQFIAETAKLSGAAVTGIETVARDVGSIAGMLDEGNYDLIIMVGGTGEGRADATGKALAARGALVAHNLALRPGRSTAIGRLGATPIVALPGAPNQAFAAFLALVLPVLGRLSGISVRQKTTLPLARKISSTVGLAEIVLVKQDKDAWVPLAVGDFSLEAIRLAQAWLAIPGGSEGYAAGTPVAAWRLRDFT